MDEQRRQQYLAAIGIERWELKQSSVATPADDVAASSATHDLSADWAALQQKVSQCMQCDLHKTRTQTVFGVGNQQADWLVIGEAPGADEDAQGEPFVGRAGQLLNPMLLSIGLKREEVYIANILKCRPPQNRDPRPEEVQQCASYLNQQIEWVKPKVILAVGRIAAQNLLETDQAIGRLRGKVHTLPNFNIPVIVTYHPAYLLRKPSEKAKSWQDLKLARHAMMQQ